MILLSSLAKMVGHLFSFGTVRESVDLIFLISNHSPIFGHDICHFPNRSLSTTDFLNIQLLASGGQPPSTFAMFLSKFCWFSPCLPVINMTSPCKSLLYSCQFWKERIIPRDSFVIWCLCLLALNIALKSHPVWDNLLFQKYLDTQVLGLPGCHQVLPQNLSQQRPCDSLKAIPK